MFPASGQITSGTQMWLHFFEEASSLYHEDIHSPGSFPVYELVRWHTVGSLDEQAITTAQEASS